MRIVGRRAGRLALGVALIGALALAGSAASAQAQATRWDGEWEGMVRHDDLPCSPCRVQLTISGGKPSLRATPSIPSFSVGADGQVNAELAINLAGSAGRSHCRLSGAAQTMAMVARGSCGNSSSQAELVLRRISPPPQSEAAAPAAPGTPEPRTVALGALDYDIKPGTEIGRTQTVSFLRRCMYSPDMVRHRQQAGAVPDPTIGHFEFEQVMRGAGYAVRGQSLPGRAAYLVFGKVAHMDLTYCIGEGSKTGEGLGSVTMEWTIVSALSGLSLYETATVGVVRLASGEHSRDGMREVFAVAYRDAVRQFSRDRNVRNVVSGAVASVAPAAAASEEPLSLKPPPRLTGSITNNLKNILPAVAEIKHPHGVAAAFAIDARGYLLTNAHVVGNATYIDVRFADGQTVEAQVLRRDPVLDLALLKVERAGLRALPLRTSKLALTEKVFAIGNPQGLMHTITDGIVSAYRPLPENGQDYIQVAIALAAGNSGGPLVDASGNVVGIAASSRVGTALKLHFFIPIEAALQRLNLVTGG